VNVLYVDTTVRKGSRTAGLAQYFLSKLGGDCTEVRPHLLGLPTVDEEFIRMRTAASASGDFQDKVFLPAKQFAQADIIVIAAPLWDLSFPASLKQYFEHINVLGLTFDYNSSGEPFGLCKAKTLVYITTAGGPIYSEEYGFGYVKALAQTCYGIKETVMFKAEGLDIYGADTEDILAHARQEIDSYFENRK
jgi:FMN-dependent NADH-azoreductase